LEIVSKATLSVRARLNRVCELEPYLKMLARPSVGS
jgi:hypothetical protein